MSATKKKTICIVMGGHFSATIGGAQYQAKCVVEGLKESKQFNIYYLTRAINPGYCPDGYQIVQIAKPDGIGKHGFVFDTLKLLRVLKKIKPDVVYQRGLKAHTGAVAYYARQTGCHSVFHIASDHSLLPAKTTGRPLGRLVRWTERQMEEYGVRNVGSIIAQTQHQTHLLKKRFGRPAAAVIPNFHPLPTEELRKSIAPVRVVWIANFKPIKQPELFVRLAQDLAHRNDLHFVMIGAGDSVRYQKLHAEIEQMPNLTYKGLLPLEQVNRELAAAHIFVNTSTTEGFPNTFIQAWMRRVPTLSLEANPDGILTSEEFGFCSNSLSQLRNKLLELAEDPTLREKMGAAAQRHAFAEHSPAAAVGRLIDVLLRPSQTKLEGRKSP